MHTPELILGRRIAYRGDVCNLPGEGLVVAIHGTPNTTVAEKVGPVTYLRRAGATVDVILFDGRQMRGLPEHQLAGPDDRFARFVRLDRVHGPALIAKARALAAEAETTKLLAELKAREDFAATEAARTVAQPPLFYWNGLKDAKGAKLQKAYYSDGALTRHPAGTLTIYARDYAHFSAQVHAAFTVENDSDLMTDYFDRDRIRVIPTHPLYPQVRAAFEAQEAHRAARHAKRRA